MESPRQNARPQPLRFGRAPFAHALLLSALFITFSINLQAVTSISASSHLTKRIAIIHSYIPGEWYHGLNRGLEETLGKLGVTPQLFPIIYDSEFWLAKSPAERENEHGRIIGEIKKFAPDLVVVCDDEAADAFVRSVYEAGFRIVFTAVNREQDNIPWLRQVPRTAVTGVLEVYPISEFLSALERLLPKLQSLSIVTSKKPSSEIIARSTEKQMNSKGFQGTHKIRLKSLHLLGYWEQWKEKILALNDKNSAVWILVPYDVRDTNNIQVPLPQMGKWLRKHLKTPYIGMSVVHTKMGGLMSVQVTPYDLGRQAAELAAKYFQGKSMSEIPIEKSRYHQIEVNVSEAKRLGVTIPKELIGVVVLTEDPFLQYGR